MKQAKFDECVSTSCDLLKGTVREDRFALMVRMAYSLSFRLFFSPIRAQDKCHCRHYARTYSDGGQDTGWSSVFLVLCLFVYQPFLFVIKHAGYLLSVVRPHMVLCLASILRIWRRPLIRIPSRHRSPLQEVITTRRPLGIPSIPPRAPPLYRAAAVCLPLPIRRVAVYPVPHPSLMCGVSLLHPMSRHVV